jgi:ribosomal protein L10
MVREDKSTWKASYFQKLVQLLDEYPKCFIVGADNVGSKQMQEIRIALRGKAVVLMGKNTMMRKAIRGHLEKNPDLERLLPHIKNNVGFVFTKEELTLVRYITSSVADPSHFSPDPWIHTNRFGSGSGFCNFCHRNYKLFFLSFLLITF